MCKLLFVETCVCVCGRFDLEQNQAQAEVQRERTQRERLAREKDLLTSEMLNLRQQLQVSCSPRFFHDFWLFSLPDVHVTLPLLPLGQGH